MSYTYRTLIIAIGALCSSALASANGDPTLAQAPSAATSMPGPGSFSQFWWSDYDGDGVSDAFVVDPDGDAALLANHGDGSFENVTVHAGLTGLKGVRQALWQDVDGDNQPELFVVIPGGKSKLFQCEGGLFSEITQTAGLALEAAVLQGEWLDTNGDARADLHLSTSRGELLFQNLGGGQFQEIDLGIAAASAPWSPDLGAWSLRPDQVPPLPPGTSPPDSSATQAGTSLGGVSSSGAHGEAAGSPFCWDSIKDQATMNCLTASSTPTVGTLYPLGLEFNIDGSGRVGIGTLAPGTSLDVVGSIRASGQLISTAATGAPLVVTSTDQVPNLNADLLDGLDASSFSQLGQTIEGAEIADLTVTGADMAFETVTGGQVKDNSLTGSDVFDSSLTGSDVMDGSLTGADLANGTVTGGQVADGSLTGADVFDNSLTGADIGDFSIGLADMGFASVGSSALASGTVSNTHVSAGAAISGTKISPDFGSQDVTTTGSGTYSGFTGEGAIKGISSNGPTNGYVGVQGNTDFDGIPTADWSGFELGLVGLSTGNSTTDNYGVLGHSNGTGVRGEYGLGLANWGQLGQADLGVLGNGDTAGVQGTSSASGLSLGQLGTSLFGVYGEGVDAGGKFGNTANSVLLDGARGETSNPLGWGLWGRNTSMTGNIARGVHGETSSPVSFGVYASGGLGGTGAKYFINPHPSDPTKEVRFISLEGNESGTYFRGTAHIVGSSLTIDVPEEFALVTSAVEPLSVQATPIGGPARVWIESQTLDSIVLRSDMDVQVNYFVNGIRRGYEQHQLVYENGSYLPEETDVEFGTQYPDSYRQILVENGILNPDFTPNVALLQSLETQLPHYRARMDSRRAEEAARAAQLEREQELQQQLDAQPGE